MLGIIPISVGTHEILISSIFDEIFLDIYIYSREVYENSSEYQSDKNARDYSTHTVSIECSDISRISVYE